MKYTHFVGIDVSKKTLDFSVCNQDQEMFHRKTGNTYEEIITLIDRLSKQGINLKNTLFCMEHTGIYSEILLSFFEAHSIDIWVESALQIKKTMGMVRGKNDRIDAKRIALYAFRHQDKVCLWQPPRKVIRFLKHLTTLRNRLIKTIKDLEIPLAELSDFVENDVHGELTDLNTHSLEGLKKDLKQVERKIDRLIKEDPALNQLFTLVSSVDNIGKVVATEILITTNEFKSFKDAKSYACYAGVVPFKYESGTSIKGRDRVSHMANKKVKTLLHMSALASVSRPGELKDYYQRKVDEGKNKMSILNAVRNKLLLRVFACVKNGKLYDKSYEHKKAVVIKQED